MSTKRILLFIGLASIVIGLLVSCQSKATPTLAAMTGPGIGVGILDDQCPSISVQVGQQISWTNQGKHQHIVRAKSIAGESAFASGTLQSGDSFVVTLPEPGTYEYDCSEDGSLTGRITVEP